MHPRIHTLVTVVLLALTAYLFSDLIYMNLRSADPILPGWEEFDAAKFEARMEAGEPMLVEIYASWCPTCKAQHEAFEQMIADGTPPPVRAVRVDFDRDAEFRESLGIDFTGIIILYRDGEEVVRASGLTEPAALVEFLTRFGFPPEA